MTTYSVQENMGPMRVTVQLEPDSGIPLATFTALVSASSGSALGRQYLHRNTESVTS